MTIRRRTALAAGAALLPGMARAQPRRFPDRPIRMFVPWTAGGPTDVQMRALCEAAGRRLGQPIVIDNRPGAAGILGAQALLGARPDGHTLSQMPISVFRFPQMTQRPPFDPLADFSWVLQVTGYLFGIVVRADSPWTDLAGFLAHAAANPGRVNYGTPGVGTSLHITMEQIAAARRIDWTHVPFRGNAENTQALLGGQIDAMADASGWAELVRDGRLRLLATWGAARARRFPEAPTLRESGIDVVSVSPYGIAGPRGLEPEVTETLHQAFRAAMAEPAHVAILERFDMEPAYLDPAAYAAAALRQYQEDGEMIRRLGLRS